ncbi:MAG: YbfB/YjiJ family MFS transporter, partial [Rhodospirillales bacterium]
MPPLSASLRLTLAGFAALALAMGIGRFAYTPLLPLMLQDRLLSLADGGLIASVHFLGYLTGALVAAKLPLSPQNMMRLSLFGIGVTTLGMGLVENVIIWSVLRWIAGVCSAWILVLVSNFVIRTLANTGHTGGSGAVFSGVGGGILLIGLVC